MSGKPDDPNKPPSVPTPKPAIDGIIDDLRPILRDGKENQAESILEAYFESHQGPIPSAREIAGYEAACPGAAGRIIAMAENEQRHRHQMEDMVLKKEAVLRERGQVFAIAGLIAMLLVVGFVAYIGAPIAASVLGGGVIVAVVTAFLAPQLMRFLTTESAPTNLPQNHTEKASIRQRNKTKRGRR